MLTYVNFQGALSRWLNNWKIDEDLDIQWLLGKEWNTYINQVAHDFVCFENLDDELKWYWIKAT